MSAAPSSRRWLTDVVRVGFIVALLGYCVSVQRQNFDGWWAGSGKMIQRINLPNVEVIRVAALGYDNLYADFLMLRAVQMFGGDWEAEDGTTEPIFNYFDIMTELDPQNPDAYELGNLVLSDARHDHTLGLKILRKGIIRNPGSWRLAYLGMYTALWGKNNPKTAREFLHYARRANAPEHVLRMEEYIERQSGRFEAAFEVNVEQHLRYRLRGMKAEEDLTNNKFSTIIDGWNRVELARAAERFHKDQGRHPHQLEELLVDPYTPRFRAPTMQRLVPALDYILDNAQDPAAFADQVREASMEDVVGLPPDPRGYWYYIEPELLKDLPADDPDQGLLDRFPYIQSAHEAHLAINMQAGNAQQFIMSQVAEKGAPPSKADMAPSTTSDGFGGHFVYIPHFEPPSGGTAGPRYFSTSTIRQLKNEEPRMGLRGLPSNFPPRPLIVSPLLPPYLTTTPTIWDFPEDIDWALCQGLTPGLRWDEQDPSATQRIANPVLFRDCPTAVTLPE